LKVNDKNSRIRIHQLKARIRGSGSTPKCHGSATLARNMNVRTSVVVDADPNPACHVDEDPDTTLHFDAYPDSSFQIKAQNLEKVFK
jgi:hypothetical protein